MEKLYKNCGKGLPSNLDLSYCKECDEHLDRALYIIIKEIIKNKKITEVQIDNLKKIERVKILNLYSNVYKNFINKGHLSIEEKELLSKIKKVFSLKNEETKIFLTFPCP